MNKYIIAFLLMTALSGSILAKKHTITFKYTPNVVPQSVHIAGSFNNWSASAMPMNDNDDDGVWTITFEFETGEYQYKFVVNGNNWYQDMNNPLSVPDGYGGRNSVIRVGDYEKFQQPAYCSDGNILQDAVYHALEYPYFCITQDSTIWIKLRTKQNDVDSATINYLGEWHKMDWYALDGTFDYYVAQLHFTAPQFQYSFIIYDGANKYEYDNIFSGFTYSFKPFHIPSWISTSVFYQIFPERFANGDKSNDPDNSQAWGAKPEYQNFFGGDLRGILFNLDYLSNLGINAIYLNPIFQAPSNHKYDMSDPMQIDLHFGDIELFKELLDSCHSRGIKVMLDMVYHDTGRTHWAFQDVINNGKNSQYVNWYNIYSFPVGPIDEPNYECWWGFGSLPNLMTTNPEVQQYLFKITRYWTEMGIDGWRLDCPNEVENEFWKMFRDTVKAINAECYILGEIWGDGGTWLKGDMFDAVMNYRFRDACLDFFASSRITSQQFAENYFSIIASYPPIVNYSSFNLLGSHDTKRFLTLCNGDKNRLKLAWLFQITMIGSPSIYYGDEIGMEGDKDPDCRRTFIWDTLIQDRNLFHYMKLLLFSRKEYPILSLGNVFEFYTPDENSIVFYKRRAEEIAVIIINRGNKKMKYSLDVPQRYYIDVLSGNSVMTEFDRTTINIPPMSARILLTRNINENNTR